MKTAEDEEFERIEREARMRFVNCGRCGEKLGDVHTCTPKAVEVSLVFHEGMKMFAVPVQPAQQEPVALAQEVIGCFHAAEVEGLTAALANTTDEHLKDLVERRLMHALYAAQDVERKSK